MNRIAELCGVVVQSIIDRRFESLVVGIMRCTGFDLIRTRIYEFSSSPRNSLRIIFLPILKDNRQLKTQETITSHYLSTTVVATTGTSIMVDMHP